MNETLIEFKNVSYSYLDNDEKAINDINLDIKKGEFILLTGLSGCGKTTIGRCINGLIPHFNDGKLEGEICINGLNTFDMEIGEIGKKIGSIFQEPKSQFFMMDTTEEIAFGCTNLGLTSDEINRRIDNSLEQLSITHLKDKNIFKLSSGQKQLVAIAAVYAMNPDIYVFDEPSANLDVLSINSLTEIMTLLKKCGKTIIVLEHRLYYLKDLFDRCIHIDNGKIHSEFSNNEIDEIDQHSINEMGLRNFNLLNCKLHENIRCQIGSSGNLSVKELDFSFTETEKVLGNIKLQLEDYEVTGIIGKSGSGKTTLARIICGLLKEQSGEILINNKLTKPKNRIGNIYFVSQDSDLQLFSDSVANEVKIGSKSDNNGEKSKKILTELNLWSKKDSHPASLSRGQKQRLIIADALLSDAKIVVFDEPTSGLDLKNMEIVSNLIRKMSRFGVIIIVITHDYEFLLKVANRIIQVKNGTIENDFPLIDRNLEILRSCLGLKGGSIEK